MKNELLDYLVKKGDIVFYTYENLDEEGNPGESGFRNTERLILLFPSGNKLILDTCCSGMNENTVFMMELLKGNSLPTTEP